MPLSDREPKVWYRKIPEAEVPAAARRTAETALAFACRDLGLSAVTIQWFGPDAPALARFETMLCELGKKRSPCWAEAQTITGQTRYSDDSRILVRADLQPDETAKVVLHEAYHLWQSSQYRPPLTHKERRTWEAAAERYERLALTRSKLIGGNRKS